MLSVLGLMAGGFALAGLVLGLIGLRGFLTMAIRRGLLVRALGTIRAIERRKAHFSSRGSRSMPYLFLPVITYVKETGESAEFTSEVGDCGKESKYRVGQTVPVLYDTQGIVPAMIDTWFARWGTNFFMLFSGVLFFGAAALVYWLRVQAIREGKG